MKTRSEMWRESYRTNRYLETKSVEHIASRLRYLFEALLALSPTGQIGVEPIDETGDFLWMKFTQTLDEFDLRGIPPPDNFLAGSAVPRFTYPNKPPELACYEQRQRKELGQIFKFGKKKWLEGSLNAGSFRFAGAALYKDPSLNAAIQDDELSLSIYPTKVTPTGILGVSFPSKDGGLTLTHPTDYYVQCFSTKYTLRMYEDFDAEACLIIYDGREFGRRVISELRKYCGDWIVGSIPVTYVDPDAPGEGVLPIPAAKHIKYIYQREERIICHPRHRTFQSLPPFTIAIGPMNDIAELILLRL